MRAAPILFGALLAAPVVRAETHLVTVGSDLGRADEPELSFAEKDAERMARVLRELGRVRPEHELVLRGVDAPALRNALLRVNAGLRRAPSRGQADTLVVYYSGHADAEGLHLGDSTLSFEELKTIVESSSARVRVLIVDSCRSGGITQLKGVGRAEPFAIRLEDRLEVEGFAIITSSAESEDSQESDALQASFFTHHLITALRGAADRNGDARVTLQEAYVYAYQETLRSSGRTSVLQHPSYAYDLKGRGDLVLTHLADGRGRFGTLGIAAPGTYLVFEDAGQGVLAAEIRVSEEGARLLLPPGRYFVQRRARTNYREYDLIIERDAITALDALEYRDIRYSRLLRKGGGREPVHGVTVGAELRGPLLEGYGPLPNLVVGYGLDLPELSLGLQLRYGESSAGLALPGAAREVAIRVRADRYFDLDALSLSLGALVEGVWVMQSFESEGTAPDRSAGALGFGVALGIERAFGPATLRLEGGPMTYVFSGAELEAGAVVGDQLNTPLTYWLSLGLGWKL